MTDLDNDLRQKSAFPHLERLHNLPFAYAANVVEIVRRKEFSHSLVEWASRIGHAVNTYLDEEAKRRQRHKTENQLPWEIPALEESQLSRINMSINGAEALTSVGLGKPDIEQLVSSIKELQDDPEFMSLDPTENPIPVLSNRLAELLPSLDHLNEDLNQALDLAVINAAQRATPGETEKLRTQNAEYEERIAELEREHLERIQELEESKEREIKALNARQTELKDEVARLRNDLSDEAVQKQKLMDQLEEKTRDHEDRVRELEEHSDLVSALQADMVQEKDRATNLGVRLQEALLDVDGLRSAETTLIVQMKDMQDERTRILTDLGEAQLLAQNYESELAGAKVELEATAAQLMQAQKDRDKAIKEKSAEAERLMRDQIAEADGDRAVLEHQNLTLTKELEEVRKDMDEKLNTVKNASIRREDGLKAELKLAKAQLRDVQRREALLASELAVAKDSSTQLTQKDAHQAELLKESVQLCGKYHEACYRLMTAISASTTISGSLSLPQRANSPPPPSILSIGSNELKDSAFLVRSLEKASAFELESFADAVLKTINLARRLSKSCKQYRDLSRNKITISSFGKGDLVLFLPTRNAAVNAWAAFNVSAPHHFLHVTEQIRQQLQGKDYYLARITGTDEAIVNGDSPSTNPFGLAEGLRYYSHHVEEWVPTAIRARRSTSGPAGQAAHAHHPPHPERALTAPTAVRAKPPANIISKDRERTSPKSTSPKQAVASPKESSPEAPSPHTASPEVASPKGASKSPPPHDSRKGTPKASPKGSKAGSRRASPERSERREKRSSRPSSRTPTPTISVSQPPAPVPAASEFDRASPHSAHSADHSAGAHSTDESPPSELAAAEPLTKSAAAIGSAAQSAHASPAKPSAPTFARGIHPRPSESEVNIAGSPPPPPSSPTSPMSPVARRPRGSLSSPPPGGARRPSSVASSASSHPRGLPIPSGGAKASPAAAVTTSAENSPNQNSLPKSLGQRTLGKRPSIPSMDIENPFRPSPLGPSTSTKSSSPSQGGFLSGLSLSRKRASASGETAVDMLKRLDSAGS